VRVFESIVLYDIVKLTPMVYSYTNVNHIAVKWSVITFPLLVAVGVTWRCVIIFIPWLL